MTNIQFIEKRYLRIKEAMIIYSISRSKLQRLLKESKAYLKLDGLVLIDRMAFESYINRFHQ